jgi:hypothetical protein
MQHDDASCLERSNGFRRRPLAELQNQMAGAKGNRSIDSSDDAGGVGYDLAGLQVEYRLSEAHRGEEKE